MRIYQGAALRRAPATRGVHGLTMCADSRPGAQMCPDVCLFEPRSPSITLANRKRSPREPARPLRPDVVPAPRAGTRRRSAAGPRQLCLLRPALRPLTPSLCPPSHPPSPFALPFMLLDPVETGLVRTRARLPRVVAGGGIRHHRPVSRAHSPGSVQTRPRGPRSCTGRARQRHARRDAWALLSHGPRSRHRGQVRGAFIRSRANTCARSRLERGGGKGDM